MKKKISALLTFLFIVSVVGSAFASPNRGSFKGVIQDLNIEGKTFSLKTERQMVEVLLTEETIYLHDGEKADPNLLKNGLPVVVSGQWSEDKKTLEAKVVAWGTETPPGPPQPDPGRGGPPLIKGIIQQFNLEAMRFELKHQDPEGKERVLMVSFTEKTRFVRDMKPSDPSAFSDGEEVHVMGPITPEEMMLEAHMVAFGKFERPGDPGRGPGDPGRGGPPVPVEGIHGKVTEIDHQKMTFTLQLNEEVSIQVKYFEWTGFIKDNRFVFPEELTSGTRIQFFGPVNREKRVGKAHFIVW